MSEQGKSDIVRAMLDVEIVPSFDTQVARKRGMANISISKLATGGMGLIAFTSAIQSVLTGVSMQPDQLYRLDMHGLIGDIAQRHDGSGFTTAVTQAGKGIVGNASYVPVDMGKLAQPASMVDPYMMMTAAALAGIEQELSEVKRLSEQILSFLEEDKRAAARGNMNVLADVMNNYKHNVGNERYRGTRHSQVLDIRRDAERDIEFYRTQILKVLDETKLVHTSAEVSSKLNALTNLFGDYQSALYLYGFSTFLEVLLLENFEESYLDSVGAKMRSYGIKYMELYTEASNRIEDYSKSSLKAGLLGGLSVVSKGLGTAVHAIPIIERGPVDEWLNSGSEALRSFGDDVVKKDVTALADRRDSCIAPFQRGIAMVKASYHAPLMAYTDGEDIWFELRED